MGTVIETPHVTIENCRIQVVRQGGWGWGADERELTRRAASALPHLLSGAWLEQSSQDGDVVISVPIKVNLRLTRNEFLGITPPASSPVNATSSTNENTLHQLSTQLAQAVEQEITRQSYHQHDRHDRELSRETLEHPAQLNPVENQLMEFLIQKRSKGQLERYLAALSGPTVQIWFAALTKTTHTAMDAHTWKHNASNSADEDTEQRNALLAKIKDLVTEITRLVDLSAFYELSRIRVRIVAIVHTVEQLRIRPSDPMLLDAIANQIPLSVGEETDSKSSIPPTNQPIRKEHSDIPQPLLPSTDSFALIRPPAPIIQRIKRRTCRVNSVLPFLILGPLSQIGFLDTLSVSLSAAELSDFAPVFATALAYKVLEPPKKGWMRSTACRDNAAAAAGSDEPIDDSILSELDRWSHHFTSPLKQSLAEIVLEGHEPGEPFVLSQAGTPSSDRWLLSETTGLFSIALTDSLHEALDLIREHDNCPILVEQRAATADTLRTIHEFQSHFVVDVPPTRGEQWRPLRTRVGKFWTNRSDAKGLATGMLRQFEPSMKMAEQLRTDFVDSRVSLSGDHHSDVEDTLTLAATIALSQIAWTLWKDFEPTSPSLSLYRFADLDGRIEFRDDAVRVIIPLGQRAFDLEEHGLLQDVLNVPWLDGRPLEFSKG